MDTQSTSEVTESVKLIVPQAVFTSIRTVVSEGYRLVAASPEVSNEERTQITQRGPSHRGLCSDADSAVGLLSFRMNSGRFCVGHSSYAGVEQTGRGGNRVYTNLVVLDREVFQKFEFNPVRVHAAIGRALGTGRILEPVSRLDPLELSLGLPEYQPPFLIDHVCQLVSMILNGQTLIVSGAPGSLKTLEWSILALPVAIRESLSTSVGLKYSISRHTQLSFIDPDQGETNRMTRGHDLQWLDCEKPLPKPSWPFNGWMDLVHRRWVEGSFHEINDLSLSLSTLHKPKDLDRIASICSDLGQVKNAHASLLEQLLIKYAGFAAQNDAEIRLVKQLRTVAKLQAALLQKMQLRQEEELKPS